MQLAAFGITGLANLDWQVRVVQTGGANDRTIDDGCNLTLADYLIIATAILALPVWVYTVRHQLSQKPGATTRMLNGCFVFIAILSVGMAAAYLAMCV